MNPIPARIAAFRANGADPYGGVTDRGVVDLTPEYGARFKGPIEVIEAGALEEVIAAAEGPTPAFNEAEVDFLIPVANPEKLICIGANFPERNAEYKDGTTDAKSDPSMLIRFPRRFTRLGKPLIRPPESPHLDYEGEVTIVIGKAGRRIAREDAYDHIAALTLCNEGTIRDWVRHARFSGTQGKNWGVSGSIGPWLVPFRSADQLDDSQRTTRVNGEMRQQDRASRMMYDFRSIVAYVSTFCTLVPGDVILCGTATGAGARLDPPVWPKPGDVIEVEGIGTPRNGVEDEAC